MSEQEREQGTEEEREGTFQDLDGPDDQGEDILGGKKSTEVPQK